MSRLLHLFVTALVLTMGLAAQDPAPLRICATTPDLGALALAVGGDAIRVTTFVKGAEDPHFLEARPSMIRALSKADVLVEIGLELEIGWLPVLVDNARNAAVLGGGPGRIDASTAVEKLGLPQGPIDRSHGDVHAGGNPHFLSDPLRGLQVAAVLRDRFTALRPELRDTFAANFQKLRNALSEAMVGKDLAVLYGHDAEKLALLFGAGTLLTVLDEQGDRDKLHGWFGDLAPFRGAKVVADHDLWLYFAQRFGLEVIGFFEPKPGIAPTGPHLSALIGRMRAEHVQVILSAPYFAPQHAELVERATSARIAAMAHQVGSRPGTDDYVSFLDYNVQTVLAALKMTKR
jgi:ABC-type Zn uptake system ZnuABC Zn-binding protein ZnuA